MSAWKNCTRNDPQPGLPTHYLWHPFPIPFSVASDMMNSHSHGSSNLKHLQAGEGGKFFDKYNIINSNIMVPI